MLLLPDRWGDDLPGVLVIVDEGGKAVALEGAAAAVAQERGWAVLAVDLRGTGESATSEFELATASWLLDRDLLAERVDDLRAAVGWLSERYSTGQQLDKGRIAVHGAGAFGLVASLAAALDARIAGATSGPFATTLEELLVVSPRITPMAFPFRALETWDLPDLVRLAAPRPLRTGGARGGRGDAGRGPARRAGGLMEGTVHEVADRVWSCEQPDGPRRIRQVVIAGGAGALVVDTGLPDSPAAGLLDLLDRLGLEVGILLTHPDADHIGGTAAILERYPDAALMAGTADVDLTGDPERAIDERYAAFVDDGIPFSDADAERARARFGPAFGPVEAVHDGETLDLGGRHVELLWTPGHSPGHTVAWVARRADHGRGRRRDGRGDPRRRREPLRAADVRAAQRLPRHHRAARGPARSSAC